MANAVDLRGSDERRQSTPVSPKESHKSHLREANSPQAIETMRYDASRISNEKSTQSNCPPSPSQVARTPSASSNTTSPRLNTTSQRSPEQISARPVPGDRSLPSPNVNEENVADAFAAFILYCNPAFAMSTDTTELKRLFHAPPRSDGKNFSTWNLLELLRKFEEKEIKTWSQLVLDLGVERPSMEKGQSAQKVQQYSVRLKRWLRAMHIDAFFEYLMGKRHSYYLQVPSSNAINMEMVRDGVPFEEDMALKALNPSLRPKRGRRKNDDGSEGLTAEASPRLKRSQIQAPGASGISDTFHSQRGYPQSALPLSAHPGTTSKYRGEEDPWSAAGIPRSAVEPSSHSLTPGPNIAGGPNRYLGWRLQASINEPTTPHPLSAITPRIAVTMDDALDEPQSAVTPSTRNRSRRRHGPAVSSAWHRASTSSTGKLRGRPPTNRSVQDGPFVTFPANPHLKGGNYLGDVTPVSSSGQLLPSIDEREDRHFRFPPDQPLRDSPPNMSEEHQQHQHHQYHQPCQEQQQPAPTRPERLQLQVPRRDSGPVHLITPTVLVNNERDDFSHISDTSAHIPQSATPPGQGESRSSRKRTSRSRERDFHDTAHHHEDKIPPRAARFVVPSEFEIKRALTADLLRAEISGRKRLNGSEAKLLAEAIIRQVNLNHNAAQTKNDVLRVIHASWLGIAHLLAIDQGSVGSGKIIQAHQYRIDGDGYEVPIDDDNRTDTSRGERGGSDESSAQKSALRDVKETFDVSWTLHLGGLSSQFQLKGLKLPTDSTKDYGSITDDNVVGLHSSAADIAAAGQDVWKQKWSEMQDALKAKEREVQQLRDQVIDAVL